MHGLRSSVAVTIFLLFETTLPLKAAEATENGQSTDEEKMCCRGGYLLNRKLRSVEIETNDVSSERRPATREVSEFGTSMPQSHDYVAIVIETTTCSRCQDSARGDQSIFRQNEYCIENITNGTVIMIRCRAESTSAKSFKEVRRNASSGDVRRRIGECIGNDLNTVIFWGAQTYMPANMVHVILCTVVVVTYLFVPELGKSLYDRAVLRHNVCLLSLGCILALLGFCELWNCAMTDDFTILVWLLLQYFTIATVLWLNVICFDMTLSITRFRWMLGSGQRTDSEENSRLLLYGGFAWGGALLPTAFAAFLEYCPSVPRDFPAKPNYVRYHMGPNPVVNLYFFGIPLFTIFWNNVLFVFTTYKILRIQRSTKIATRNHRNVLKKRYYLFVRLYLLMGAPWFFGSLFACLNKLATLKICRLVQPILWLLMLLSRKKFRRILLEKIQLFRPKVQHDVTGTP